MAKTEKDQRLYSDQVQRIIGQNLSGVIATAINAFILVLALWTVVPKSRIILWFLAIIFVLLIRIFIQYYYQKMEASVRDFIRQRNYILITLAVTGCIWGASGIFLFPYSHIVLQVFIIFVLGGMISGSVGLFASVKAAYFFFSIPTILPVIINLFRIGSSIHYAMAAMLFVFWFIMMITAMRLNKEIASALNLKYENLGLISNLEKEIKERKAAEERLLKRNQEIESIIYERTMELQRANEKLTNEINERIEAEEALKNSEEKYRELANFLPQIIFETDDHGILTFINRNAFNIMDYDEADFKKGINVLNLLIPDNRERAVNNIQNVLNGKRSQGNEYTALAKNGKTFPISIHANPIMRNNKPVGMRGIIIDLTEKKQAEAEQQEIMVRLQRAEKMETLGLMAGGVAHDLNNILSGIVSYPELMLMQVPDDSSLKKPLMTMQSAGKMAAAIVQDLLTLTRRGVVNEKVVNLNDIINEYLKSPENDKIKSFHPNVKFEIDLEKGLLNILGSPVHLSKTVMNLISNAAEALPSGGTVRLSTRNQYLDRPVKGYDDIEIGDYVVLSVSDNGIGISQNDLNRIFEPFFTKKVMGRSGTGLGMSVVWGTVKDHRGYINVESGEGKGSVFSLYFPMTRKEPVEEEDSGLLNACQGNGESILLVDDARDQREIASAILSSMGYSVTAVSSGEDAIHTVKENSFDLIVLDMIMDPGMDGLDTYRKILEIKPDQRAIIASGYSETDRVKEAQRLGAGIYVQKPYTMQKLGMAVKEELNRKRKK